MTGEPFNILPTTDSTNNHAMNEARMGQTSDGTAYFALDQYQGKGQRAKTWNSKPGENIILSVVKDCSGLQLNNQFQLSVAVALACFDFFSAYAGDETRIKWPNDLYWRDRKAGGILIENMVKADRWDKAIIGMGININQTAFDEMEGKPVSLKQITGKAFDPIILAKELCQHLENRFSILKNKPFAQLLSAYNKQLFKKDEVVTFKRNNILFQAKVNGVDKDGHLLIMHGVEERIPFGEITWLS
jgi:BirA family transcriptional regulator, biotin operon repressor / biotin---[acetyl-CoA-carboxylase] ligase